jgi:hypothetical protein
MDLIDDCKVKLTTNSISLAKDDDQLLVAELQFDFQGITERPLGLHFGEVVVVVEDHPPGFRDYVHTV